MKNRSVNPWGGIGLAGLVLAGCGGSGDPLTDGGVNHGSYNNISIPFSSSYDEDFTNSADLSGLWVVTSNYDFTRDYYRTNVDDVDGNGEYRGLIAIFDDGSGDPVILDCQGHAGQIDYFGTNSLGFIIEGNGDAIVAMDLTITRKTSMTGTLTEQYSGESSSRGGFDYEGSGEVRLVKVAELPGHIGAVEWAAQEYELATVDIRYGSDFYNNEPIQCFDQYHESFRYTYAGHSYDYESDALYLLGENSETYVYVDNEDYAEFRFRDFVGSGSDSDSTENGYDATFSGDDSIDVDISFEGSDRDFSVEGTINL